MRIFMLLTSIIYLCFSQKPEAVLEFRSKIHDFGSVPKDTLLTAKFSFKNTGNVPLKILAVNPDCTCTGFELTKKEIPAQDSAYIELKFDTKNKHGEYKIYTVVTANTKDKLYKLTLKANVR